MFRTSAEKHGDGKRAGEKNFLRAAIAVKEKCRAEKS